MKLQNIFLILALITNIKVMILFFNKNNIELMLNFFKTGNPKEWVNSKLFKRNVIWVLILSTFFLLFFWFFTKDNGLL